MIFFVMYARLFAESTQIKGSFLFSANEFEVAILSMTLLDITNLFGFVSNQLW